MTTKEIFTQTVQDKKTQDFIAKARKIHGDKYDYSKVDYKNSKTKVCIICPIHGEFLQRPSHHTNGIGCPYCGHNNTTQKLKMTKESFIAKAQKIHGDKYDYSKVNYINNHTKVNILCKSCNKYFSQTPQSHLSGCGCPCCGNRKNADIRKTTKKEFILKAKKNHGNKYDYSKVEYINSHTKVCIICPQHGIFWQTPSNHLRGQGCPKCASEQNYNKSKITTEEFIEKAQRVHKDKYDYSEVNYVNNHTKVKIVCPFHGAFYKTPQHHLAGQGCPKCSRESMSKRERSNTCDFITKAIKKHGDKFDYSLVDYVNGHTKIKIRCNSCNNIFEQTPNNHLNGNGCPYCSGRAKDVNDFIKKAREVHGNKYDYSKVVYIKSHENVIIICPIHGEFEQSPHIHMRGVGCPYCGRKSAADSKRMTTEEFISKAKVIHNNKYDYSRVKYVDSYTDVIIGCPKHGWFYQRPNNHLNGKGCPFCSQSHLEERVRLLLDKAKIKSIPQKRFEWLKNIKPMPLDFYIPTHKIAIECQGRQHFEPCNYFGGEKTYTELCVRDDLKNKLCKEHGIEVLYFADDEDYIKDYRYPVITDIDELISKILDKPKSEEQLAFW